MQHKKRTELDILKGFAIIAVLFRHFAGFSNAWAVNALAVGCNSFVNVFFMISAYLALKGLDRTQSIKAWYSKKFLRIAPDFYLACLIFALLTFMGCYNAYAEYWRDYAPISMLNIIEHLTLTIAFSPRFKCGIIGVEWYVGVLALFLAVTPLLKRSIKSFRASVWTVLIVSLTLALGKYFIVHGYDSESIYRKFFEDCSPFNVMGTWMLGFCIYHAEREGMLERKRQTLSTALLIFSVTAFVVFSFTQELISLTVIKPILVDIICLPIVLAAMLNEKEWHSRILSYLGQHSYSIYLWHFIIIVLYVTLLGNVPAFGAVGTLLFTAGAMEVSVPFSILMEKPVKLLLGKIQKVG